MTKTIRQIVLSLLILGTLSHSNVRAEEAIKPLPTPQKKSVVLATILGLDMIPGDALFYAGKPGQAFGDIALTAVGAGAMFGGLILGLSGTCFEYCDGKQESKGRQVSGLAVMGIGAGAVVGGYLWDLIGGISGVVDHNKKFEGRTSWMKRVSPQVMATDKGGFVGAQITF